MFKKSDNGVHGMSTAVATEYVRRMVAQEAKGPGDTDSAPASRGRNGTSGDPG